MSDKPDAVAARILVGLAACVCLLFVAGLRDVSLKSISAPGAASPPMSGGLSLASWPSSMAAPSSTGSRSLLPRRVCSCPTAASAKTADPSPARVDNDEQGSPTRGS